MNNFTQSETTKNSQWSRRDAISNDVRHLPPAPLRKGRGIEGEGTWQDARCRMTARQII
jgi:hypothetical protein